VEGARLPAGAYKRAEFPAAFPTKKQFQQKKIPAPQRTEIPGKRKQALVRQNPRTRSGTSTAEQREGARTRRKLSKRGGVGEAGNAPLVLEGDEREALGLHPPPPPPPRDPWAAAVAAAAGLARVESAAWRWRFDLAGLLGWACAGGGRSRRVSVPGVWGLEEKWG
jgi:hypothetical protein